MAKKRKTKRKASAFALRVGKFRLQGHSFKASVRLAKSGGTSPRRKTARKRNINKLRTRSPTVARKRRSKRRSSGLAIPSTNKLLKILAFTAGATFIGATILPQVSPQIKAAAAGFFAGGPIGAGIAFVAQPTIARFVGGAVGGNAGTPGVGAFV